VTGGTLEEHAELKVVCVVDGYVYFSTMETFLDAQVPCWFLSLDLETSSHIHPYIMPWPSPLVHMHQNKSSS
jgi:hypothetical protein